MKQIFRLPRRLKDRDQAGFVIVIMAISLTTLVLLIGFAVDLGSWYLAASKLQRASDVAALSATSSLPSAPAVQASVDQTLTKNKISGPNIQVDVHTTANTVDVSVTNKKVPTYFVSMLFPNITVKRTSEAQSQGPIPLGNPYNVFGAGNLAIPGIPVSGFTAAINGLCATRADGGMYESMYDGNIVGDHHDCSGASPANPNFRPGKFNGYTYEVDVPAAAGPVVIKAYDPQMSTHLPGSIDYDLDLTGDADAISMNTNVAVFRTTPGQPESTDQMLTDNLYKHGESPGRFDSGWTTLYSETSADASSGVRHYKVRINMSTAFNGLKGNSVNAYALMASEGGALQGCDTRNNLRCPRVYGLGAVSVFNTVPSGVSTFYLAEIQPALAGTTITAYMWDPGEGASQIQILDPNNVPVSFNWDTKPNNNMAPAAATGFGNSINVAGVGAPQPEGGIQGTGTYNDRLVTMTFQIPPSYTGNGSDYWWKIQYTSGTAVTDRTTFGVVSSSGTPSHLTK